MNAALLPPIPQPPHDPTSWLLDNRVGWRNALLERLEITGDDALALAQTPDSGRSLTESSGSFGGLTTPVNVALGPDGSLYLLDGTQLKRFDPCTCQFEVVPYFGGKGDGPRQLSDPYSGCDLRLMVPPYDKTEKEIIDNFEIEFKSKMQECAVLIIRATSDSEKWTIAGFSDARKFLTVVIDDPCHELSRELKKEPINKSRIVKLALSSLGRTPHSDPHGIAIQGGNLFICDTGNHRVSVFALHGFVLRGHWLSPATVTHTWNPYDITFDSRGRAFVTDPANGAILRFTPAGPWDVGRWDVVSRFNGPKFIASDCQRYDLRLMVASDSNPEGGIIRQFKMEFDSRKKECAVLIVRATSQSEKWIVAGFNDKGEFCAVVIDDPNHELSKELKKAPRNERRIVELATSSLGRTHCQDNLYVTVEGLDRQVRWISTEGEPLGMVDRPDKLADRFPPLPFGIDAAGNLQLGALCLDTSKNGQTGMFDRQGKPVAKDKPAVTHYEQTGTYQSKPLDSALYRCQWHRVILYGQIPPGASVVVSTYTAEADVLPDPNKVVWETLQTARSVADTWDCLIRSGGGRYLWLKLEFRGNGRVTPKLERIVIEFPRISLSRFLPAVFLAEPHSADFTDRFLSLFDTTLRSIETKIDRIAAYFDPLATPTARDSKHDFLSWLASWIGITLDRHWSETKQRRFLKQSGQLFDLRGTREGLWRQLLLLLDLESEQRGCHAESPRFRCSPQPLNCVPPPPPIRWTPPPLILEHYKLRRWLFVGAGRLGEQAVLWGKRIVNRSQLDNGAVLGGSQLISTQDPYRDPFHVYAHRFTVFVPVRYRYVEAQRRSLEKLLAAESPAHTVHQLCYVEPRFRIGFQSMIGFDSVIARLPPEARLGETKLGPASLLGTPPYAQGEPSFEIGKQGRIGTTTKLG